MRLEGGRGADDTAVVTALVHILLKITPPMERPSRDDCKRFPCTNSWQDVLMPDPLVSYWKVLG